MYPSGLDTLSSALSHTINYNFHVIGYPRAVKVFRVLFSEQLNG